MRKLLTIFTLTLCFMVVHGVAISQTRRAVSPLTRTVTIATEPNAKIWIDGIFRGETDETGKLAIKPVKAGTRKIRVRADGFKELNKSILRTVKGEMKIVLVKTRSRSELAFQEAERVLAEDKYKAIDIYKKAVRLNPRYSVALIALARAQTAVGNHDEALKTIAKARRIKRIFPEASVVEGRAQRGLGDYDKAIAAFDRAIREGKGFQPEAHTGLALLFKEEAESAKADGDSEDEEYFYGEAAKSFEKAIDQLSATEPVVYLFLGKIYEDTGKKQKAIAVYQRFLRDMPNHGERSAVESYIYQLRKPNVVQ